MEPNLENPLNELGRGDVSCVSRCVLMVEEHFFLPNGAMFSAKKSQS